MAFDESKDLNIAEDIEEIIYTDEEKDQFYNKAMFKMEGGRREDWEAAISLLNEIPGWKDADEKLAICQERYQQLNAQYQAELAERHRQIDRELKEQEIQRKDKRQYGLIVFGIGLVILILLLITK